VDGKNECIGRKNGEPLAGIAVGLLLIGISAGLVVTWESDGCFVDPKAVGP
jgi:hypothetical protein